MKKWFELPQPEPKYWVIMQIKKTKSSDKFRVFGKVIKNLGGGVYQVKLENLHFINAHVSGKMRKYSIRVLEGDNVEVEMSVYDNSKGRIVRRF